jgi:hypothetical protein
MLLRSVAAWVATGLMGILHQSTPSKSKSSFKVFIFIIGDTAEKFFNLSGYRTDGDQSTSSRSQFSFKVFVLIKEDSAEKFFNLGGERADGTMDILHQLIPFSCKSSSSYVD